ncbi:MAG: hypothetical protein QOH92_178 [Chloroflexota bacterium]|jgi:hypothetical protein|nr:hypothetical protein [Chloroflexota bacterium]
MDAAIRHPQAQQTSTARGAIDRGIGDRYVGAFGILVTAALMVLAFCLLFYGLMQFWPPPAPSPGSTTAPPAVTLFRASIDVSRDYRLFVVAALGGALGGMVHSFQSLTWYVGNRKLVRSWLIMYALLPLTGAAMALIFYIVLRAGLVSPQATEQDISPFGFVAIAALVGLFSEQASQKLKQVFETLLTPAPKGDDYVAPNAVRITGFVPTQGEAGVGVTIRGSGFTGATSVEFNSIAAIPTVASDNEIRVSVPAGAESGPITVTSQAGSTTSASSFTVLSKVTITSFAPTQGPIGSPVLITGRGLGDADSVEFNQGRAVATALSDTTVLATVPPGAISGPVSVRGQNLNCVSSDSFTVTPPAGGPQP